MSRKTGRWQEDLFRYCEFNDVKLSSKGQVTLPKHVREALGVKPGDEVRFLILGNEVRVVKPVEVMSLSGMLKRHVKPGFSLSLKEIDDAIADAASQGEEQSW